MESLSLKEENTIKDIRNVFRLKIDKLHCNQKYKKCFLKKEETKAIKDRALTDIKKLYDHENKKIIINQ